MFKALTNERNSSSLNSSQVLKNKELFSDRLNNFLFSVLRKAIDVKVLIVGFFVLTFILMVWLFYQTKSELSPLRIGEF